MPTAGEGVGRAIVAMLAARDLKFSPGTTVDRINPSGSQLILADDQRVSYDLLVGVPPHRPPEVVNGSGLAHDTGLYSSRSSDAGHWGGRRLRGG